MSDKTRYSIERELAAALVRGGLSLDDFCALTREEWEAVAEEIREGEIARMRESWEQTRQVVYATLSPHLSRSLSITELMPLPWDGDKNPIGEAPSEEQINDILTLYCNDNED